MEDESVEMKCMTLNEAQTASAELSHFLQEKGSALVSNLKFDASEIGKELVKTSLTTRHHQPTMQHWFKFQTNAGDGGCPP